MSPTVKSAVIRGLRTFVAAFIVVDPLSNLIGAASGSQPIDTSALRAGAVAGLAALVSLVWRLFIDPLPVPTLADKNATPHA